MTLTATSRASASASGSETQTVTTSSFTPASTSKLYLLIYALSASGTLDLTVASNTGGLTFTLLLQNAQSTADSEFSRLALYEATVAVSPGAMTITLDAGASTKTGWIAYGVFDVTGSVGTPGVKSGQIIGNSGAGAAGNAVTGPSGTLPTAGTTGNLALMMGGRNNDTTDVATAPAAGGFSATALIDTGATIFSATCIFQSSTFTSTTATIADLGQTISAWHTILVEIEEAASAATNPFPPRWDYKSPQLRM